MDMMGKGDYEYALPFYGTRRPVLINMIFEPGKMVEENYSTILRDGKIFSAETDLPHPKGRRIWVLAKASPLYTKDGTITGAIEAIRDITDRKNSEEELRAANEQLAASGEELRSQYDELVQGERRIRESESRLGYMIGFYERADTTEKELCDYAVEGAGIVTGSPLGYLAFLNDNESELAMYAWSKEAMTECSMRDKPLVYKTEKTGLWGEPVRERRPVITNAYEAPDPKKKGYPDGHPRIIRHMGVPVIEKGHIVLVAGVANKVSDYTDRDGNELALLLQGLWTIIKRKRTEQTQRESESRYRSIIENAPVGMHFYELKPDGSFIFTGANPGADQILGIDNSRFVGKTIEEAFPGLTATEIPDQYRRIAAEGGTWQSEQVSYDAGTIHGVYAVTAFRILPGSVVAMFSDITERKRSETELHAAYEQVAAAEEELRTQYDELAAAQGELRESEEKYRLISENSPDMIFFVDPEGYVRYVNTLAAKAMRAEPSVIIGKKLTDLFTSGPALQHAESIRGVMNTRTPVRREMYEELPLGGIWIDVRLSPVIDGTGRVLGVLGLSHDISDRKQAEEALRESELKYRVLVENSHDIIYTISAEGIITFVSPSWTTLLGHNVAQVVGEPFQHFVHPADIPACETFLASVVSTRQRQSGLEYRVFHADGSIRIHTSTISPIFDDKGSIISYIGNARDITEMKQFQNAIRESNRKLNLLNSITRHDVVNQLTVVQGYTQLAALRKPDPVTTDFLAKIALAVDTIRRQIEFTRTYQDLGAQAPAWFRVSEVIRGVKPPEINLIFTGDSCEIFADPMIAKVFFNLFDNAVKYGKHVTTVTVGCEQKDNELAITFADNGIGIPLNEKQKIFDKGYGRHTGFGLFLAREILAITGITIHETGAHGKGAMFEITVPKGAYRLAHEQEPVPGRGRTDLI